MGSAPGPPLAPPGAPGPGSGPAPRDCPGVFFGTTRRETGTAFGTARGSRHRHRPRPGVFFAIASGETGTGSGPSPRSSSDPRYRLRDRPRGRLPFPGTTTDRRYCPRDRPEIFEITPRFLRSTLAPLTGLLPNPLYLPGPGNPSGSASETPPDLRDGPRINPSAASTARLSPGSPVGSPESPPDSQDSSGINAKSLVPLLTTATSPASPAGPPHHSWYRLRPPVPVVSPG
ncbi:unnamed protein product [Coccothraustes coccothraustes]